MKVLKGALVAAAVLVGLIFIANILAIAVPNFRSAHERQASLNIDDTLDPAEITNRPAHEAIDPASISQPINHYHQSNPISYRFALLVGLLSCLVFALLTLTARKSRRNAAQPITTNEADALRELMRMQDRMEQRITNLETILLSRTHTGVPNDKY